MMSTHPDDPVVLEVAPNTCVCPDSPEQRARFERMCARMEERRHPGKKKKPAHSGDAARAEAYKQAFRQPQGQYDRGVVGRY